MMDAIQRLLQQRQECCAFYGLIVGDGEVAVADEESEPLDIEIADPEGLNESQLTAMRSWRSSLALIWGPPGNYYSTDISCHSSDFRYRNWQNYCHCADSSRHHQTLRKAAKDTHDSVNP